MDVKMKIVITGGTGFIGSHLCRSLRKQGHDVLKLGRSDLSGDAERLADRISGADAVLNLAGAPINKRWTFAYKQEIVSSRVDTTRRLVQAMAKAPARPKVLISTSAIGAFDSRGRYSESDPPNAKDFLGRLSMVWESAALEANPLGIRTLIFRFGLVLGRDGGMMKQLLPPFRLGLGGPVGDGSQHFSWIHINDLIGAYRHALENPQMSGVYHICAPNPVTNLVFTRALGHALRRPTPFRVPQMLLKLVYGQGAEVMTSGQQVISERLPESGFQFRYPELDSAIQEIVSPVSEKPGVSGLVNIGPGS